MTSIVQKIFITLGFITLIVLSVIPLSTEAQPVIAPTAVSRAVVQSGGSSWITDPLISVVSSLLYIIMKAAAGLLGLAGLILDAVITVTVVDMAANFKKLTAINDLWTKIRDIGNMTFIFILLYQGIRMVLGLSGTNIKKVITGIIMAAIFVNFSLFITKVIIDASNIVTLGFYNSISNAGGGSTAIAGTNFNFGFSGAFMKPLGITGILNVDGFKESVTGTNKDSSQIIVYIGGIIFMLIAIFVFLIVSILFVVRYLAFIIVLIMSPIAFLNFAIDLGSLSKKYWDTLLGQALFGPVYMFLTWLILSIAGSDGFLNDKGSLGLALASPNKDTISVVINFILLIGLLIFSVLEAKKQSTKGGIVTSKWIDQGQSYVGGALFGGASWAGRSTLGRYGQSIAENDDIKRRAAEGGKWARLQLLAGNKLASSSFDARNTDTVGTITGKVGSFGKGINTKGYRGYVEDRLKDQAKKDKERAEQFKLSDTQITDNKELLAEYEKQLKDDPSIEGDKKTERQKELLVELKAEKDKLGITVVETEIATLESKKTKAEKEKEEAEKKINQLKADIKAGSLAGLSTSDQEAALKIEEAKIPGLTKTITETINELSAKNKTLASIIKTDTLQKLQTEEKEIANNTWISPEYEKLIADSGGRTEKKGKGGVVTEKAVSSTSNTNILAYAKRIEGKTGLFSGYPNILIDTDYSKRRARAVKKLAVAGKTPAELLAEAAKAQRKADAEKKGKKFKDDDEDEDDAPAAPAPAPAAPAPTPTPTP